MRVIIDRFEDDYAIVELQDKTQVNMPKILLPKSVKEGDVIEITINDSVTEKRRKAINELMGDVWE